MTRGDITKVFNCDLRGVGENDYTSCRRQETPLYQKSKNQILFFANKLVSRLEGKRISVNVSAHMGRNAKRDEAV